MTEVPLEIERKLLVDVTDLEALSAASTSVSAITQTYLTNDEGLAERVRRREVRTASGSRLQLTHTSKRAVSAGVVEEDEHEIDDPEYAALVERRDPTRVPVVKTRYVVPWAGRVLEIDEFSSPRAFWMLEVELPGTDDLDAPLDLPPWLAVTTEVTGDPAYANWNLALLPPGSG
jgi:CYTH domain-containing protein